MKRKYNLSYRLIACALLLILFLQSCEGFPVERQEEKGKEKEEVEKDPDKIDNLNKLNYPFSINTSMLEDSDLKWVEEEPIFQDFNSFQPEVAKRRLLLSLDGGGIRGILEAYLLNHLEETVESVIQQHFNDPAAPAPDVRLGECFDFIAGTSTGGIIALAMRMIHSATNRPKLKMKEILGLYEDKGNMIFPAKAMWNGWLSSKFSPETLENLFLDYFGKITLKDLTKPTMLTGYDLHKEGLYLFRSYVAQNYERDNYQVKDVARATSAAPTYFPAAEIMSATQEKHIFVDGGVAANNPTMHAYEEAKGLYPDAAWHVISLGTGSSNLLTLGDKGTGILSLLTLSDKQSGGKLQWANIIASVLMNSTSNIIDDLAQRVIEREGNKYTRLQFELDQKADALDNASVENIKHLIGYVKRKLERGSEFQHIREAIVNFYAQHDYYVFHRLVDWAYSQLKDNPNQLNLSNCYLSDRALWEITHAVTSLGYKQISCLDLSGNDLTRLSGSSLSYLNQLGALKFLNLNNTNLHLSGLRLLKQANLSLNKLKIRQNPALQSAEDVELVDCTQGYDITYFDPELHCRLGQYYEMLGEEAKAIKLYKSSNDVIAQLALAKLYLKKTSDESSVNRGLSILQFCAENKGSGEAQYMLGYFYKNSDKPLEYFISSNLIPQVSGKTEGQQIKLRRVEHWYKLAIMNENSRKEVKKMAAAALGRIYEDGQITVPIREHQPRDARHQLSQALKYYEIAKEAGSTGVIQNIKRVEKELGDILKQG